jgi:hypothetical protein
MGIALVIFLLVERAAMVHLLKTPASRFLAPGFLALLVAVLWYIAQQPKPPLYALLVAWLGLWVAAMMVKSTVKDGAQKPPTTPAP